ncbi:MAG TPA: response regulator [Pyrinomonadaceae bacterium]
MKSNVPPIGRILCTEDDADARDLIVCILEGEGYHVTITGNSTNALAIAQRDLFDLILVDSWMPGLSGQELTVEIRRFNQSTPILFYSGAAYEIDKQEARDAGAQGYLTKPDGITHLVDEVGKLIAEARIAFPVTVDLPS